MNLSRTMSTQHPDNVALPFFGTNGIIGDSDEIREAFYAFAELGIREQLWDFEGKDVDNSVVRKLLLEYPDFFKKKQLGKDVFLTYRVPNPDVEKNEGKILLETLENIPRSFDTAKAFYQNDIAPIFELAVPMVSSSASIIRIADYYKKYIVGRQTSKIHDTTIGKWLGSFSPEAIRIIPLFEDKESMLNAHTMSKEFIASQKIKDYLRVWLARSDPALNYGSVATVLIEKIALQRLHALAEKLSVDIHPTLGCGSAPFRGNFKPTNVERNIKAYPSVQTFTIQSAFKYDYPEKIVKDAVATIESTKPKKPLPVDEKTLFPIIEKLETAYQKQIKLLAPLINEFSAFVPRRRKRKLHIGLFGYSRSTTGVHLPRAIPFCCSLYSLGLPPELLGMHALTEKDVDALRHAYPSFEHDIRDAAQFLNKDTLSFFPNEIQKTVSDAVARFGAPIHDGHKKITSEIVKEFKAKRVSADKIEAAGKIRGFLG